MKSYLAQAEDTNGAPYIINGLTLRFMDSSELEGVPPNDAERLLNSFVSKSTPLPEHYLKITCRQDVSIYLKESKTRSFTPWYRVYCDNFMRLLRYSEHETINHPVAVLMGVSSEDENPIQTFTEMYGEEHVPDAMKKTWIDPNLLKFFVMVHDGSNGNMQNAQQKYSALVDHFGVKRCFFLNINNKREDDLPLPEFWKPFLMFNADSESVGDLQGLGNRENSKDELVESLDFGNSEGLFGCEEKNRRESLKQGVNVGSSKENASSVKYGALLGDKDIGNINNLVSAFTHEALVPHMMSVIQFLNENVAASRRGISRSLFSATKKWFGSSKQQPTPAQQQQGGYGPNGYDYKCAEAQMRKLGDYAFMLQDYGLAFIVFQSVKRDYHNDKAFKYVAGAQEMSGLSLFMKDATNNSDADQYFESAISLYSSKCSNFLHATRATMLLTELYRCRGQFREAASVFIRMTGEESDLRSALLLEQAAHCFLSMKPSMYRKYVFHLILAGHRFSKASQRLHALRCYAQSLSLYDNKDWKLAEDHIHFTIGRQSYSLGQVNEALKSFELLLREGNQYPQQESSYFAQYVHCVKHALSGSKDDSNCLPELPVPLIDHDSVKLTLSNHCSNIPSRLNDEKWMVMEKTAIGYVPQKVKENWMEKHTKGHVSRVEPISPLFKAAMTCYTKETDNSSSPVSCVDEPLWVELLVKNPLQIVLQMYSVSLLCHFQPLGESTVCEEIESFAVTSCIEKLLLDGREMKSVKLSVTPKKEGVLYIKGLVFSLAGVVRGQRSVSLKGKRLNKTRKQRMNVEYGADKRLEVTVTSRMPLLRMEVYNFPEYLLAGEMKKSVFNFANKGTCSLTNLKVICDNASNVFFGNCGSIDEEFLTLENEKRDGARLDTLCMEDIVESKDGVFAIDLGKEKLEPGDSVSVPVWIRGGNVTEEDFYNMLFCYESEEPSKALPYRCLRYTAKVKVLPSMKISGFSRRSMADYECYILGIDVENMQGSAQFRAKQLNVWSKNWHVEKLGGFENTKKSQMIFEPREITSLFFKVSRMKPADKGYISVCPCPFESSLYEKSLVAGHWLTYQSFKPLPSVDVSQGDVEWEEFKEFEIGASLFWEVNNKPHKGFLNLPLMDLMGSSSGPKLFKGYSNFSGHQSIQMNTSDSNLFFALTHKDVYNHDFSTDRKCSLPLTLTLKNYFDDDVKVIVELIPSSRLNSEPSIISFAKNSAGGNFVWTGKTKIFCSLRSRSSHTVSVTAAIFSPGVYDLNRYIVYVYKSYHGAASEVFDSTSECIILKSPQQNLVTIA